MSTLAHLQDQLTVAVTQVRQLQLLLAPVAAWTLTLPESLAQSCWRSAPLIATADALAATDPQAISDLAVVWHHLDALHHACGHLTAAGEQVQAAGATGEAAWHERGEDSAAGTTRSRTTARTTARITSAHTTLTGAAFLREQVLGEGAGMESAETPAADGTWVAEERDNGEWWLATGPAQGDRVRLPNGRVGTVSQSHRGEVWVTGGDDPRRSWGTCLRYPYQPPRRRLPALDAPQAYPIPDQDLAVMRQYVADAVLRRGVWVYLRPGDAQDYPDGLCALCEGEGRLDCLTCGGDATLTCSTCGDTNRCQACSPDDDCDHGCSACRGAGLACPDCQDGTRPCPQRRARWCHLDE